MEKPDALIHSKAFDVIWLLLESPSVEFLLLKYYEFQGRQVCIK